MIASINFVIIVPLVFEFRDELSVALWLVDAMYAFRTVVCEETEDLQWRSGTWATIPSSWIAWSDWEKRLCQGSGNNGPVLMDDQAVCFLYFEEMVIECSWT
jgi:hypothetical protein